MKISREKIEEMFQHYIERRKYRSKSTGDDAMWSSGECSEAEKWLSLFGVDLDYCRIQEMINGKAEIKAFPDDMIVEDDHVRAVKTKQERCRFCHRFMGKKHNESHCVVEGWEDDKVRIVSEEQCEQCERFDSKFIEYPLMIKGIDNAKIDTSGLGHKCGTLCEISPCSDEYRGKSFVGIYLGDLPIAISTTFDRKTGILENRTVNNAAIFVPALKKIIYGCESWWRKIKSLEDFKGISEDDIANTWYIKLLQSFGEEN